MKLLPGYYSVEFSYVAQPPVDLSPIVDDDEGAVEVVSSGDENSAATKVLDRKSMHERVERRRKLARRAHLTEEQQKSLRTSEREKKLDEKIESTKERLRRYQARLDAAEKQACATSLSEWSMLCNLWFEGSTRLGAIRGTAKQVRGGSSGGCSSTAPSPGAEDGARGSIVSALIAESSPAPEDGAVHILEDSNWTFDDRILIELRLFVKSLRGSVLGCEADLADLSLKLEGEMDDSGWCIGEVEGGSRTSNFSLKKDARVRFVMRHLPGPRCVHCGKLVPKLVSYGCSCQVSEYCSALCQKAHETKHKPYCPLLAEYAVGRSGRTVARMRNTGLEFTAFWRALNSHSFSVLVDHGNPMGVAYEMAIGLLVDAEVGLDIDFLSPPAPEGEAISDDEILAVNVAVFQALFFNAMQESNASLAATALNFLYRNWDNVGYLDRYYGWFLATFGGHSGNLIFVISTLPEYVLLYRPRFEFANISIEMALQTATAADFWARLDQTKILLSDSYDGFPFSQKAQNIRTILVPEHQRQILHLLARVFIIMASRQPVEAATKLLERAVDCYKDAVEDDKARNDLYNMGVTCLHLSLVYRLFPDQDNQALANPMKVYALELLKKGEGKTPADRAAPAIKKALAALVTAEGDPAKAATPADAVAVAGAVMQCDDASGTSVQERSTDASLAARSLDTVSSDGAK